MIDFNKIKTCVVFGAGHGIGLAFVNELLKQTNLTVYATYRVKENASELLKIDSDRIKCVQLDPLVEKELVEFKSSLPEPCIDLIINTIGVLEYAESPEKSIRSIDIETMTYVFKVNAFVTPLILKVFRDKISRQSDSVFATLSAKVGSISDNRIGGWYSYRSSKAALNMFIKTAAIEMKRNKTPCCLIALHPGTVATKLSEKFRGGVKHRVLSPSESADSLLNVIKGLSIEDSGSFYTWDNQKLNY